MCAMCVSVLVPCRGRFVHVHRSHTQLIFSWVNFTINCKPGYFFPSGVFPPCSFLPSSLPFIFCTVWKPLLSPVSPVLCQFVSNLQLLRLFSSLLPLGSVSGTVFFFFLSLFTLPFPPFLCIQHIHSASLSHPSVIPVCLSLLTHLSHTVKFWVLITWPLHKLNSHSHSAWTWAPETSLKLWMLPQV